MCPILVDMNIGFENPTPTPYEGEPQPTPAVSDWRPEAFRFPNGAQMGMDRSQVKAIHEVMPKRDKGSTLEYQTQLLAMDAQITYTFDDQDKLCFIAARFTQTPWDPNYYFGDFRHVSSVLNYAHHGLPDQEEPALWADQHIFDPRDASKWLNALKRSALTYRHTWQVDGILVTHVLEAPEGRIQHLLFAEPQ